MRAGVKKFIYISSIKVNGESTDGRMPFIADEKPLPVDAYGISKHAAELDLRQLVQSKDMDLIIIKLPLVYGPKVKGNFRTLIRSVNRCIPLPFKWIKISEVMLAFPIWWI